ncbi:18577_t:CDS:2, partial [Racocetra persica]
TKLDDYLEKLAKLLPKYIKEIKIWMVLQPGYKDEIVIPFNAQVVSKSIQFDEFKKPEKIKSKNLKNLTSYNTLKFPPWLFELTARSTDQKGGPSSDQTIKAISPKSNPLSPEELEIISQLNPANFNITTPINKLGCHSVLQRCPLLIVCLITTLTRYIDIEDELAARCMYGPFTLENPYVQHFR